MAGEDHYVLSDTITTMTPMWILPEQVRGDLDVVSLTYASREIDYANRGKE